MPIRAGDLRHPIRIERLGAGVNDYGEEIGDWTLLAAVRAQVLHGRGQERREAAIEQASVPATFRIRRGGPASGVTAKDRIRFDPLGVTGAESPVWDIQSIVPLGNDGIEITAVRAD